MTIRSEIPIPAAITDKAESNIQIRFGRLQNFPDLKPWPQDFAIGGSGEIFLRAAGGAGFAVIEGREIIVQCEPGDDAVYMRLFAYGQALAAALIQRGRLVLHASAVQVADGSVAFLGPSGGGKSTVAAALAGAGGELLCDDVVPVSPRDHQPRVYPGLAVLKLWPDAAQALGRDPLEGSELHPDTEKRVIIPTKHVTEALPLRRIYVLVPGESVGIGPMSSGEALRALVANSYMGRLLRAAKREGEHFAQCVRLVDAGVVSQLSCPRPASPDSLNQLSAAIMQDFRS